MSKLNIGDTFYVVSASSDRIDKCTVIEFDYLRKRYSYWRNRRDIYYSYIKENGEHSTSTIGAESFWMCYSDKDHNNRFHTLDELKNKIIEDHYSLNLFNFI